jgi:hypothetical protein
MENDFFDYCNFIYYSLVCQDCIFGASEKRLKPLAAIRVNAAASMQQEVQLDVSSFAAYLHQASRKKGRSENRQTSVIP